MALNGNHTFLLSGKKLNKIKKQATKTQNINIVIFCMFGCVLLPSQFNNVLLKAWSTNTTNRLQNACFTSAKINTENEIMKFIKILV